MLSLIRTAAEKEKTKKAVEYAVDLQLNDNVFSVDAPRGSVDAHGKKLIFTYTPPASLDINAALVSGGLPRPLSTSRAVISVKADGLNYKASVLFHTIITAN